MVERLEAGLSNLARVWTGTGMLDAVDEPGDGAAGGLGAGLRAFCGAEIRSGAELIAEITGFDGEIADADLLVTGEGRTDAQTTHGKLCSVLAARAAAAGARTILVSGAIAADAGPVLESFDAVFAAVQDVGGLETALCDARSNLSATAASVGRVLAMSALPSIRS
jgi:glycerate kinase